jgi:hypothetical protein
MAFEVCSLHPKMALGSAERQHQRPSGAKAKHAASRHGAESQYARRNGPVFRLLAWPGSASSLSLHSGEGINAYYQCLLRTLLVLRLIDSLAAAQAARHHCGL